MARQTPDAIGQWADRQGEVKPQGRAGHLSHEQKTAIRLAYLESAGTTTYIELGRRFDVNRETVSACLKGPEFDKLRAAVESEARSIAIQRLKAVVVPAADAWVRAIDEAADKGDHKPAKDLLMHTGTIEPLDDAGHARGSLVLFIATVDGRDVYKCSDGGVYDIDPDTGRVVNLPRVDGTIVAIGAPLSSVHVQVGAAMRPSTIDQQPPALRKEGTTK